MFQGIEPGDTISAEVQKVQAPCCQGTKFCNVAPNICALSMEVASCHPSHIHNFEAAPRFLENLRIPALLTLPPQMCHDGIRDC